MVALLVFLLGGVVEKAWGSSGRRQFCVTLRQLRTKIRSVGHIPRSSKHGLTDEIVAGHHDLPVNLLYIATGDVDVGGGHYKYHAGVYQGGKNKTQLENELAHIPIQ